MFWQLWRENSVRKIFFFLRKVLLRNSEVTYYTVLIRITKSYWKTGIWIETKLSQRVNCKNVIRFLKASYKFIYQNKDCGVLLENTHNLDTPAYCNLVSQMIWFYEQNSSDKNSQKKKKQTNKHRAMQDVNYYLFF